MQNAFWQSGSYSKWFLNLIDFITIIKRLHWNFQLKSIAFHALEYNFHFFFRKIPMLRLTNVILIIFSAHCTTTASEWERVVVIGNCQAWVLVYLQSKSHNSKRIRADIII